MAVALLLAIAGAAGSEGEPGAAPRQTKGAEQGPPVTPFIFDGDLRDLPPPPEWQPGDPIRQIPRRFYRPPGADPIPPGVPGLDPLLSLRSATDLDSWPSFDGFTTPSRNFTGQGFSGVFPPDTVGDVGPDHYIQMINGSKGSTARVFDKAQPVPNELATFAIDSLGPGSGPCRPGFCDPIVLYDRQAGRWLLSEMAETMTHLCVYVSQTADPVSGGWYVYGFETPALPDYPKYAVWATDANGGEGSYVVTTNDWPGGPAVYALDRGAMLNGEAASAQRIGMLPLSGFGVQGPAPAEPDGPAPPPPGAPAIIMRHHDTEIHDGPEAPGDLLEMWLLDVDWENSANTTLTQVTGIDVAEFDSDLCGDESGTGSTSGCFPQPGSDETLDTLREVIMHRLQYFNHGDHESLLGNFVVDVDGTDHGGIRWFELRRSGGEDWELHQEGTYAIDADHRWMGSLAMDRSGNIALGHNVVSKQTYPALRYTGRMAGESPGWMTQPEAEIHAGDAEQWVFRWGDYASMNVDPEDDCTFWFTGMDTLDWDWRTQIASFRFDSCGCETVLPDPAPQATVEVDNRIDLSWEDSGDETAVEYLVQRSRVAGGPYHNLALVPDSSPGLSGGPGYTFEDHDVSGGHTYYYVVIARDGSGCRSQPLVEAVATATGACTLAPLFAGLTSAATPATESCAVDLTWPEAQAECGGPVAYNVYRDGVPGFTPGPENLVAGEVSGTGMRDGWALESEATYYYVVRAVDLSNGVEEQNLVQRETVPTGPNTGLHHLFFEDFEAPNSFPDWTVETGPDHVCGEWQRVDDEFEALRPWESQGWFVLAYPGGGDERPPIVQSTLTSPVMDQRIEGTVKVELNYKLLYRYANRDYTAVAVWDGQEWVVVDELSFGYSIAGLPPLNVSQYVLGNPEFRIRFIYEGMTDYTSWALDDIRLTADVIDACTTVMDPP